MNAQRQGRAMTRLLFHEDAYLQQAPACVAGHTAEGGIVLDQSIFHPAGGGQPGDSGWLAWSGGRMPVATALFTEQGAVALVPAEPAPLPAPGVVLVQSLDWARRHRHMRLHTALHLLSALVARPAACGQIGGLRAWADFGAPPSAEEAERAERLERRLNSLILRDLPVVEHRASAAELRGLPALAGIGAGCRAGEGGLLRLIGIGEGDETVDLQPCEGTHVARTAEIGALAVERIEAKGGHLRVTIALAGGAAG